MATTLHETDPTIYLTNGTRNALGLEGISDAPQSVVQAAQDAYYAKYTVWPYVDSMPNVPGKIPDPDPPTDIGTVTASGKDLIGTNVTVQKDATTKVTAAFDGTASDVTYKWVIRSGGEFLAIVGDSTKAEVELQGLDEGGATFRCTLTSPKSSDSPKEVTLTATITEPSGP